VGVEDPELPELGVEEFVLDPESLPEALESPDEPEFKAPAGELGDVLTVLPSVVPPP